MQFGFLSQPQKMVFDFVYGPAFRGVATTGIYSGNYRLSWRQSDNYSTGPWLRLQCV